jgi:hypothetical protein
MRDLCKELKLGLQKHQYANSFWNGLTPAHFIPPGQWCMSPQALAIWQKFQEDFKKFDLKRQEKMDQIDWWTQLRDLGFGPEDLLRRDLMDSTDFGETIRMNSALNRRHGISELRGRRGGRYRRDGLQSSRREFAARERAGPQNRSGKHPDRARGCWNPPNQQARRRVRARLELSN